MPYRLLSASNSQPERQAVSVIFETLTTWDFIAFISSMIEVNFCFEMCLLRINSPNLCPNMIHIDALDFSGWHSKEVISFFWCSVYIYYFFACHILPPPPPPGDPEYTATEACFKWLIQGMIIIVNLLIRPCKKQYFLCKNNLQYAIYYYYFLVIVSWTIVCIISLVQKRWREWKIISWPKENAHRSMPITLTYKEAYLWSFRASI